MTSLQLFIILLTITLSACAQLLLKLGMEKMEASGGLLHNGIASIFQTILSPLIFSGLLVYAISVIAWLWVLSKVELSIAYPFVGVSFIFTLLFGAFLLNEAITPYKVIGTLLIIAGCIVITRSA